jgi:transposase
MDKKHCVKLTEAERIQLQSLLRAGHAPTRTLTRARILLKADSGPEGPGWTDAAIQEALDVGQGTIERIRRRYCERGLEGTLYHRKPRRVYTRKLDGKAEARLIALACGETPAGQGRWSLRLLAERMVELGYAESVSYQSVRRVLKKTNSNPGS